MPKLTLCRLREVLHYDPKTGVFTWLISTGRVSAGTIAGSERRDGYVIIRIDERGYYAHRLAWFYMMEEWPKEYIDHIDGHPENNIFNNFRPATNIQNSCNQKHRKSNTSGFKGVSWHKNSKKWRADIRVFGKKLWLGHFDTPEVAHAAYISAAKKYHGEFARAA